MIRSALFVRNSQPVIRSLLSKRTLRIALRASKRFDPNSLFRSKPGTFVLQTNKEIIMSVMEPAVFTVERADGTSLTLRGTRYLPEGFRKTDIRRWRCFFHGFGGNRIDFSGLSCKWRENLLLVVSWSLLTIVLVMAKVMVLLRIPPLVAMSKRLAGSGAGSSYERLRSG